MKKSLYFLTALLFGLFVITSCNPKNNKSSDDTKDENVTKTDDEKVDVKDDTKKVELFTSEDGSFKIYFPGKPTLTKEPVDTELGKIQMYTYMYEESVSKVYMVAYSDYPKAAIESGDTDVMLDGAKNGFLKNLNLRIDEEKDITLGDYEGIYFKAQGGGYYTVMKDYLIENRLYQIGILTDKSYPSQTDIDAFLNSFELVKK